MMEKKYAIHTNVKVAVPGADYLIGNYYHQDAWDEFLTHEDLWSHFVSVESIQTVVDLIQGIDELLQYSLDEIHDYIRSGQSGGLYLKTPQASAEWLKKCRDYMEKALDRKKQENKDK